MESGFRSWSPADAECITILFFSVFPSCCDLGSVRTSTRICVLCSVTLRLPDRFPGLFVAASCSITGVCLALAGCFGAFAYDFVIVRLDSAPLEASRTPGQRRKAQKKKIFECICEEGTLPSCFAFR